jgi:O-antigen ligase
VVDPFEGSLLYQPVGYANSIGILAAIGIIVALGLFTERRATAVWVALLCVVGLSVAALVLSESRGALAAGVVGLAIAGVCLWRRRALPGALGLVGLLVVAILVSPLVVDPARLQGLLTDRAFYWPVAWHALDAPLHGLGSGAFAQLWALEQPIPRNAIDAHSLFLEALLELGVVGLMILVATLVLPLAVAPRLSGRWAAGATGAYAAFLVHAAIDWDWEMPVVTIAGLACGAALLAGAGRAPALARRPRQRVAAGG